ncbi:MAG: hypothetical protein IKN17_07235 [Ruminococcus sp.]|nr:hypothetical protein [Ruminococcus sp.]
MKTRARLFVILLCAGLLASCADVPENVISKAEERENNSLSVSADAKPESIPVSELKADVDKALSEKYANFTLSDKINVVLPERYVRCDFKQTDGVSDRAQELAGRFFDAELIKGVKAEEGSWDYSKAFTFHSCGFRDEEKEIHYFLWDNGFLCFMKSPLFYEQCECGKVRKIYHADRKDDLSDKYDLNGTEISVAEAVEAANKWLDENYADLVPDYKVSVKTVLARQNDYGENALEFYAHLIYKGIELDELNQIVESGTSKLKYANKRISMIMKNSTDISYFTNGDGMLKPDEGENLDKIISLSSALRCIESTFTDFETPPEINSIGLKYTLSPQYYAGLPAEQAIPYNAPGTKYKGRIVWEFVIDVPHCLLTDNDPGDVRRYILVDAETGDIEFEFDINKLGQ